MLPSRESLSKRINQHYTLGEEIINSLTHGVGALLSLVGLIILVALAVRYGDVWHIVSFAVYGVSLIILYTASTLYHGVQHKRLRPIFRIIDHASIFLLIAGTYTPFLLISMRETRGWWLMGLVWGIAVLGILYKVFFIDRYEVLSTLAYVAMGWMCLFAYEEMLANVPRIGVIWLILGGVAYTVGVIFYALERLPYNHGIWHLFVLGGSVCHFVAVWALVG